MKKLKLTSLSLSNSEILSREQLKNVLGGDGSGGGGTCDGKASTIYCRDSNRNILKEVSVTGCPSSGSGIDQACSGLSGYTRATSSCAC